MVVRPLSQRQRTDPAQCAITGVYEAAHGAVRVGAVALFTRTPLGCRAFGRASHAASPGRITTTPYAFDAYSASHSTNALNSALVA